METNNKTNAFWFFDTEKKKEEDEKKKAPATLNDIRDALSTALEENAYRETENAMKETADKQKTAGERATDEAARRSEELYNLLLSYENQQNGRYGELIREITRGDYRKNAGAQAILEEYRASAAREGEHAFADGAAANGGNPDSYAAAQAARGRLAVTKAGEEAARAYYGEQLDRLLAAITASGTDMNRLYETIQGNVNERSDAAKDSLSIAADLLRDLNEEQNDRRESDTEILSSLLERAEDKAEIGMVSPMQVDREYKDLIAGTKGKEAKINALIKLWQKYPSMQEYIVEKYSELLEPIYQFK